MKKYLVTNTSDIAPVSIASNPVVEVPCGATVEVKGETAQFLVDRYPFLTLEVKDVEEKKAEKKEEKEAPKKSSRTKKGK